MKNKRVIKEITYKGFQMKANSRNRWLKPTKTLYPYDAARGWQDLNMAKMLYKEKYPDIMNFG